MKFLGMLVSVLSLAAVLTACGEGFVVSFEGLKWEVTPTPQVGFDRPPPSNTCPDGSIVLNILDCPLSTPSRLPY